MGKNAESSLLFLHPLHSNNFLGPCNPAHEKQYNYG